MRACPTVPCTAESSFAAARAQVEWSSAKEPALGSSLRAPTRTASPLMMQRHCIDVTTRATLQSPLIVGNRSSAFRDACELRPALSSRLGRMGLFEAFCRCCLQQDRANIVFVLSGPAVGIRLQQESGKRTPLRWRQIDDAAT